MAVMKELLSLLKSHAVFAPLSEGERETLTQRAIRRQLERGETLTWQGDVWPYLFLVAEGELEALKVSPGGRSLLVTTFGSGELFWGLAFFHDEAPSLATLQARTPSIVYLWHRREVEPFFLMHGKMGWELCRLMIQRMERASLIVEELAFQPIAGRLARLLLDQIPPGRRSIHRSLTLDELAARLGTTREVVCRTLYRFADRNLITITRTELSLTDREGLSRLIEGE